MVELAQWAPKYMAAGVQVAAMSYDSLDVLEGFHSAEQLPYPLLRDEQAQHVKAYGVLNDSYEPGHRGYGIPHPGVLLIGPDGTVLQKFAVAGYRERPPFTDIMAAIQSRKGTSAGQ